MRAVWECGRICLEPRVEVSDSEHQSTRELIGPIEHLRVDAGPVLRLQCQWRRVGEWRTGLVAFGMGWRARLGAVSRLRALDDGLLGTIARII